MPITLGHVSKWIASGGDGFLETLPHPRTQREFPIVTSRQKDSIQEAFLKGHSMVINSLHRWSEPGALVVQELYEDLDLPIDCYMYLTPPRSKSYGLHKDVMDAWMVQLVGSKHWTVCAPQQFEMQDGTSQDSECQEVIMQGGDVMYLPFSTLHKATTQSNLSAHLTINIERQYYVWATFIIAMLHKTINPRLKVVKFVSGGAFKMEGESDLEIFLSSMMSKVPLLARMPLGTKFPLQASAWLTRSLCSFDLPVDYISDLQTEFTDIAQQVATVIGGSEELQHAQFTIGSKQVQGKQIASLISGEAAKRTLPWLLELGRYHAVTHFISDGDLLLPPPEVFSSLAAAREHDDKLADRTAPTELQKLFSDNAVFQRRYATRAVLLLEDQQSTTTAPAKLQVNSQSLQIQTSDFTGLQFCLGLFGNRTAMGRPFKLGDVPGEVGKLKVLLKKLVSAGALTMLAR